MATRNQMIRRAVLLSAALASMATGGVMPASGAEPTPPGPTTARPSGSGQPGEPSGASSGASSGATGASSGKETAPQQSTTPSGQATPGAPDSSSSSTTPTPPTTPDSSGSPSTPPDAPSGTASDAPGTPPSPSSPSSPSDPRALPDPAAPDAPLDPRAPGAPGVPGGPPSLVTGDPRDFGAQIFRGNAFDTCQAPSVSTMRAWKGASPFGAVGVYIGGRGRACPKQKHLSPAWVAAVHKQGWKLLPVYVGSQSPCVIAKNKRKVRMSGKDPYGQGRREGQDAVRQARKLGMTQRSAVYLDMEAYRYKNKKCADTTLRFVQGWNSAVRAQGYVAGFYSSANSGIAHLEKARAAGARGLPTAVWFARWRVRPSVNGERNLNPKAWQPHRRIHQHTGNKKRTYGGRTVSVDHNLVDAPVAIIK
ncbi:glycoside hydrolase domain-containing protein [Streptomyces albus]|uniref:glycoside hydrolase domain-containing protein n=1 Tax=Streptomyces sp. NRRL F-5917 TaxID=1463873 RepID=UPI0004C22D3E|nr:glycoside hydrolase domain-containing protein [Streptomyces sp. NRRL F-5917]